MNVLFTTCTFNHLPRAFSLADSVAKNCPNTHFIIGLLDELHEAIEPTNFEIIKAVEMGLPFLDEMCAKYTTLELNSALKPYFANHILNTNKYKHLIYLDSDILLYNNLDLIYEILRENSIVLSPHSLQTVPSGYSFDDRSFLLTGIFNAGFFAVNNDDVGRSFLHWWKDKLKDECFIDARKGMFAEQLFLNLVPLYFDKVYILRHLGCNVAYWNLENRKISVKDNSYFINDSVPLIFFHFSGASMKCFEEDNLSVHQNKYTFSNRPDVIPLFKDYITALNTHGIEKYNTYFTISKKFKTKFPPLIVAVKIYRKIIKRFYMR